MGQKTAKGDDIALTVKALHHAQHGHCDIIHLFSGDGDYVPLIRELRNMGLMVMVSAFSSGLSPKIKKEADKLTLLDGVYFQP